MSAVKGDPLGGTSSVCDVTTLATWAENVPSYEDRVADGVIQSPFPYSDELNRKIVLWEGDITEINSTAIVHVTNESISDRSPVSEWLYKRAGPSLRQEIRQEVRACKTGDAKITKAYDLPSRYVIHTVGPRYNIKYKTAAESALYNCYRSVFRLMRENQLHSVALSCVHSVNRGYPIDEGAHIAIRTVRRFLEQYGDSVDTVVFVVSHEEQEIYQRCLPLYFPRSVDEERHVLHLLPEDLGNENGEPVIAERKIRIMDNPIINSVAGEPEFEESVNITEEFESSTIVGRSDFARMSADHDARRREALQGKTSREVYRLEQQRRYQRFLKRARQEDLSSMAALKFIYQGGVDRMGRTVVVLVGRNLPATIVDMEKFVLYMIHLMDVIVNRQYVVVYLHTQTTAQHRPEMAFLKHLYQFVDQRYRKNLRAFYILHPTFWSRVVTWFFTTFTASSIKEKVFSLHSVKSLYEKIDPDQVSLPEFVLQYDLQVNGYNYLTDTEKIETGNEL